MKKGVYCCKKVAHSKLQKGETLR